MKLLFDENLSRKLVARLYELYPGSAHVVEFDLLERPDREIWDFALKGGFPTIDFPAVFISESISARQHRRRIRGSALCCNFRLSL